MHGDAAHDHAFAAAERPIEAEQGHDIAGVGVEAEFGAGLGDALVMVFDRVADIDDVAHQMAVAVLRHRVADMAAEPPIEADQRLAIVALDRQALDVAEAEAGADLRPQRTQPRRQAAERKVVAADFLDRETARSRQPHRFVDFGDIGLAEPADPVVALHDLRHGPREAAADRLGWHGRGLEHVHRRSPSVRFQPPLRNNRSYFGNFTF
jgi:hypothetical protein